MEKIVFLSHAGADAERASDLAQRLQQAALGVRLDRTEIGPGASFLTFMEASLRASDYCLLLWSRVAAASPWVTLEWEAALYRSVQERRSFLISARLDDALLPALLGPRICVDLFPTLEPGMQELVDFFHADNGAEQATGKVLRTRPKKQSSWTEAPRDAATARPRSEVFVTSALFEITLPWRVRLDAPAGVLVDEVVRRCKLPTRWDHHGRVGVHFEYTLAKGDHVLANERPLDQQGVYAGAVLWLETRISSSVAGKPVRGGKRDAVYRGPNNEDAQRVLHAAVAALGLDESD